MNNQKIENGIENLEGIVAVGLSIEIENKN